MNHSVGRDTNARVTAIWKKLNEIERRDVLIWASEIPYQDHHMTASKGRTEDTGGWLIEHYKYKAWQTSDESMILWLHGIRKHPSTNLDRTCLTVIY
jgi:hypothetical protein